MEFEEFAFELNAQLTYLIAFTRQINELDMAAALFGEFRGMQDAGWSTAITAHEVYAELRELGSKGEPLTRAEFRQTLCLYTQLSEAGGVYEGMANLMGVVQLKPYSMWPFQDMVRVRDRPPRIIGPNANAMFRRLAYTAESIGMPRLAALLEIAFRDDIRNGISHADYIIAHDGLRLRRRNGGNVFVVTEEALLRAMNIGLTFFQLFDDAQHQARETFRPARQITGRFSENPPMAWTVELDNDGSFSIRGDAPGPQIDPAFERQQRINDRLGGKIFAAYAVQGDVEASRLIEDILETGFDVQLIQLEGDNQLSELEREVRQQGLYRLDPGDNELGCLFATPFGFQRINDLAVFQAMLPLVEPLEIN